LMLSIFFFQIHGQKKDIESAGWFLKRLFSC